MTVKDGSSSAKRRCILHRYTKNPVSSPIALKYARNALLFIWVVQRMRRTPPEAGADCWAREDPADTKPAGGDDGCGGLLGDRAAPRARLAVRMLPRPAPAPDAPWRPPGSGPLRVLFNSIIHFRASFSRRRPDPAPFLVEAMSTSGPLHLQFLPRHGTNTSWQGAD
ncbi:unnamed protein product [Parnassius apollo]|uniref:(apollo) hypothetical protein n=1 Tax=Parnassius apollo TaxID=110799 RepID=A0A8S3W6Z3_PARAO|nr:unnamed protein product [Parnassius apollo]